MWAVGTPVSASPESPGPGQAPDVADAAEGEFPGARMGRTPKYGDPQWIKLEKPSP